MPCLLHVYDCFFLSVLLHPLWFFILMIVKLVMLAVRDLLIECYASLHFYLTIEDSNAFNELPPFLEFLDSDLGRVVAGILGGALSGTMTAVLYSLRRHLGRGLDWTLYITMMTYAAFMVSFLLSL